MPLLSLIVQLMLFFVITVSNVTYESTFTYVTPFTLVPTITFVTAFTYITTDDVIFFRGSLDLPSPPRHAKSLFCLPPLPPSS